MNEMTSEPLSGEAIDGPDRNCQEAAPAVIMLALPALIVAALLYFWLTGAASMTMPR